MNYKQSLAYLDSFLNFERATFNLNNRSWNLDRMRYLLQHYGHPERNVFTVLIAGTKGKGSTGFLLESILREAGYKTGFYSSPHLETPLERIRINGRTVSKKLWVQGLVEIRKRFPKNPPKNLEGFTYFEMMTLLAALLFKKQKIEAGIFEVGMGGRLDATNALDPQIVVLTPIHMDHEAVLGPTLRHIAREKAAVIRPRRDVIVAPQAPEAMREIMSRVRQTRARLFHAMQKTDMPVALEGDFQKLNAGVAVKTVERLRVKGFSIEERHIRQALLRDGWPGRMEHFRKDGLHYILDGAHNPASIEALVRHLEKTYPGRQRLLVFATSRDKKSAPMVQRLGKYFNEAIFCRHASSRSQDPALLALQGRGFFERVYLEPDCSAALERVENIAGSGALVVITGSFYLIGEARKKLRA